MNSIHQKVLCMYAIIYGRLMANFNVTMFLVTQLGMHTNPQDNQLSLTMQIPSYHRLYSQLFRSKNVIIDFNGIFKSIFSKIYYRFVY